MKSCRALGGFFDLPPKIEAIAAIQGRMAVGSFWDDSNAANKVLQELKALKAIVEPFQNNEKRLNDLRELLAMSADDEEFLRQIEVELATAEKEIAALEVQTILGGPFDRNNAILSINAGAGGTESCDWASMLLRMYTRWADLREYKVKLLDELSGE